MAKPDDVLKQLKHELALRKALVLDKYDPPQPLDCKAVLAASTELSKMKQPVGRGWRDFAHVDSSGPVFSSFTPTNHKSTGPWFEAEYEALIYRRNRLAADFGERLKLLDDRITALRAAENKAIIAEIFDDPAPYVASASELEVGYGGKPPVDFYADVAATKGVTRQEAKRQVLAKLYQAPEPTTCSPPSETTSDKSSAAPSTTLPGASSASTTTKRTSSAKSAASTGSTTREPASDPGKPYLPKNPRSKSLSASDVKAKADKAEAAANKKEAK